LAARKSGADTKETVINEMSVLLSEN